MLTQLMIRNALPRDKVYQIKDKDGLCLRIYPTGKTVWIANFRNSGKKICKTLGSYPDIGLKEAREQLELLKTQTLLSDKGKVVIEEPHSFSEVYSQWLEVKKIKVKNWKDISNRIDRYILPTLGKVDYCKLTPIDFVAALKTDLYMREKYETIKRICMYLKEIDVFAFNIGYHTQDLKQF